MASGEQGELYRRRGIAESFGGDAERYDRARPQYPGVLVERIAAGARDVLDVGCGTGIAARQFQGLGLAVLGVEPDERMAEVARGLGTEVEVARFEEWEPAGRVFDAVVAAQAWHWVDPAAGGAKAAAVLRPGGRLAAFWNVFQLPDVLAEAFGGVLRRVLPEAPFDPGALAGDALRLYGPIFAKAEEGIAATSGLADAEQWRDSWEWTYTRDAWLDQMPTFGPFTRLPKEALPAVLADVGRAVDDLGGAFTARFTTVTVTAVRDA